MMSRDFHIVPRAGHDRRVCMSSNIRQLCDAGKIVQDDARIIHLVRGKILTIRTRIGRQFHLIERLHGVKYLLRG